MSTVEIEESYDMGSFNHSYLQFHLARLLFNLGNYTILTELSLEIQGIEYRSDICLYSKRKMNPVQDIIKMTEMPLLIVEILSPTQGVQTILDKLKIYFDAGIQSCWIVYPSAMTIVTYYSVDSYTVFNNKDIVDKNLNITLPVQEIFE